MLALLLILAEAASPYTPEVPIADGKAAVHSVTCDDPREKAVDCQVKARELCKGEFTVQRMTETEKPRAAGKPFSLHGHRRNSLAIGASTNPPQESLGGTKRVLTFTCGAAPAKSPEKPPNG